MSLLHDEQGNLSSARTAFWVTLVVTLLLIVLDAFGVVAMAGAAYTLLGSLVIALASWAGGPRIAQYLAPQIAKVGSALASASTKIAERRKQGADDGTEPT